MRWIRYPIPEESRVCGYQADALERQYRIYVAELRRRYSLESKETTDLTISGSDAAMVTAA
jgi:hypothetical protein